MLLGMRFIKKCLEGSMHKMVKIAKIENSYQSGRVAPFCTVKTLANETFRVRYRFTYGFYIKNDQAVFTFLSEFPDNFDVGVIGVSDYTGIVEPGLLETDIINTFYQLLNVNNGQNSF